VLLAFTALLGSPALLAFTALLAATLGRLRASKLLRNALQLLDDVLNLAGESLELLHQADPRSTLAALFPFTPPSFSRHSIAPFTRSRSRDGSIPFRRIPGAGPPPHG